MAIFQELLVDQLPNLRRFARFLAHDRAFADDLVQETVVRALTNADKFAPGTNLKAWLSTILRNQFYNELRSKRARMTTDVDILSLTGGSGGQEAHLEMRDLERAADSLPAEQREAVWLVGANGYSYGEAAAIVGCAEGTVKSRVCRARATLNRRLSDRSSTLACAALPAA